MTQMPERVRAVAARRGSKLLLACCLPGLLAACASTDPLYDTSRWNPTGTNAANLAAQIVDPADLQHGRHVVGADALQAAAAVARLRQDHVKHLSDSGLAQISVSAGPTAADTAATPGIGGL